MFSSSPAPLDRHLSSADEAELAEALDLRRKQIDREISEFTVEKEKEFRKFEKRLRSEKRDAERQKILQCEREVGKVEGKGKGKGKRKGSTSGADGAGARVAENKEHREREDYGRVTGVRFGGATEIPIGSDGGQRKKENEKPVHERELEIQGLFTPTYLPLLRGAHQDDELLQSSHRGQESAPAASDPAALVSGSAPLIPTSSPHLSPNDPRKMSMSARRSSSRSDTSASSLRSSIRDPKQTRSPKRVLFSIDNVLVSPSTSPTRQGKISAFRKTALTNIPTTNGHVNGTSELLYSTTYIGSSHLLGWNGYEHVRVDEFDDLFPFDEDIEYGDHEPQVDGNGEEELGNEELENAREELPTSSPHAGSVPIEIKWPARRDPMG
ncbi:MAG: hypothetical protein Q9211_003176 [Gyalolechia sp. 1 TL-2023]